MLLIGGVILLRITIMNSKFQIENLGIGRLLIIGVFQSLAMIPGVSRALVTILGGQLVGLSQIEAVEMSFLLAVPTMAAATGLDLIKSGMSFSSAEWMILGVGFGGAFISAVIVIKWLINFVKEHDLKVFGWYRIILAMVWGAFTFFR